MRKLASLSFSIKHENVDTQVQTKNGILWLILSFKSSLILTLKKHKTGRPSESHLSLTENPVHHWSKNPIFLQFYCQGVIGHPLQWNRQLFSKYKQTHEVHRWTLRWWQSLQGRSTSNQPKRCPWNCTRSQSYRKSCWCQRKFSVIKVRIVQSVPIVWTTLKSTSKPTSLLHFWSLCATTTQTWMTV